MPTATHRTQTRIPIPTDRRWVTTPLEGSDEKIMSDVFPTYLCTPDYPVVGTTTWNDILRRNDPKYSTGTDVFGAYVLRFLVRDQVDGLTRGVFSRNIPEPILYKTETKFDDHPWYPIFVGVDFMYDKSLPRVSFNERGERVTAYRLVPIEYYYPGISEGTKFTIEHYVSSSPTNIVQSEVPIPDAVTYIYDGVERTFERCLHGKVIIKPQPAGFAAWDLTAETSTPIVGVVPGQIFFPTNFPTWETYKAYEGEEMVESALYHRKRVVVTPPDLPPLKRRKIYGY